MYSSELIPPKEIVERADKIKMMLVTPLLLINLFGAAEAIHLINDLDLNNLGLNGFEYIT